MTDSEAWALVALWALGSERVVIFDGERFGPGYDTQDGSQRMYYRKGEGAGLIGFRTPQELAAWCVANPARPGPNGTY